MESACKQTPNCGLNLTTAGQRREEQRDKTVYNRVLGREARDKTRTIYVRHLFNQWKQHVIQDRSIVWFVFQGYGNLRLQTNGNRKRKERCSRSWVSVQLSSRTSGLSSQFLVVCLFTRFGEDDQRKEHSSGIQVVSKLSEQSLEKKVSGKGLIVNVSSLKNPF